MTTRTGHEGERRGTLRRLAGAVGQRVAVLGAVGLLALLWMVDFSAIFPSRRPLPGVVEEGAVDRGAEEPPSDVGWPHLRGPRYDATSDETGLAESWPAEGPLVLWMQTIGRGYSGLTVVGDRVYTQVQSLDGQSVVCLEGGTGRTIWQHRYDWPFEPGGMYPGPRATPTWHAGRIYFAGPRGEVGCLDANSGRRFWSVNVNERFGGRGTDFGYSCSPTVEDGKVLLPVGGRGASMVALSVEDGSTVWQSGDEPASYCSVLPIAFEGRRYAIGFLQNALAMFDLQTGRLMWQESYSQGYDEHAAAPLYCEPLLMIARPFQSGAECYRLVSDRTQPQDPSTREAEPPEVRPELVWTSRALSNDTASSVLVGGYVYGFDLRDVQAKAHRPSRGKFKCLELATGEVRWATDATGHATAIAPDGKLILLNDRGEVILLRANPDRYEELARATVFSGEICWTAPALHRGRLYLRSPTRAACLYLGQPEKLTKSLPPDTRRTSQLPQSAAWNLSRLVGGERPYAFDPPDLGELWRWYVYSLFGVLGLAGLAATLVDLPRWVGRREATTHTGQTVFWSLTFLLAVAGTPIYNRLQAEFVFTWPVALFAAHQVLLLAIVKAGRERETSKTQVPVLLATACFLAICVGYFLACRRLSMAVEWGFLLGFLPCWPLAIPAAYRLQKAGHPLREFLWAAGAFSLFFWSVGGWFLWRAARL